MRLGKTCAVLAILILTGAPAVRAEVHLAINDGRVTLKASGATLREILAEWAKVGRTTIVNAERLTGAPIALLELNDVPERVALGVLLRSISGYVAAPRAIPIENASEFDRILVMPTTAPPRAAVQPPPPTFASSPATFNPQPQPVPVMIDPQQEGQPPQLNPRGPTFTQFPSQQAVPPRTPEEAAAPPVQPVNQPQPGVQPGVSIGVSVPGMVVPTPQQSGQQPSQPRDF